MGIFSFLVSVKLNNVSKFVKIINSTHDIFITSEEGGLFIKETAKEFNFNLTDTTPFTIKKSIVNETVFLTLEFTEKDSNLSFSIVEIKDKTVDLSIITDFIINL